MGGGYGRTVFVLSHEREEGGTAVAVPDDIDEMGGEYGRSQSVLRHERDEGTRPLPILMKMTRWVGGTAVPYPYWHMRKMRGYGRRQS
ncbi:MAG: hypothetical protein KF770_23230 [Anaerolineae bacterium]|nr:hypothetical protein [Anaerolineae bacterium]